jgi:lipase
VARLHVHEYGRADGAPVLAIHGVRGNGARFHRLGETGIGEMRVLAPDLRGHGRSTWAPPWGAEQHVADLIETLDAHDVARASIVAHSFGGVLAMRLAAAHPERVTRIALIDPAVALDPADAERYAVEDLDGDGRAQVFADEAAARAHWLAIRPEEGRWALEHEVATHLEPAPEGGVRWRFSRAAAICAWSEMARPAPSLGRFSGPVLLVVARRGSFVTPALEEALRTEAAARLERVSVASGHVPMWDAPEALAAALDAFLARERD